MKIIDIYGNESQADKLFISAPQGHSLPITDSKKTLTIYGRSFSAF
jgi:hypothetical protein